MSFFFTKNTGKFLSPFYGTTSPMAGFGFGHSAGPGGYVGASEGTYINTYSIYICIYKYRHIIGTT